MLYSKEIIKNTWGQYCDTDKLVDNMMALLTKYNHRNTEYGVCKILDKYFTAKEPLIKLISQSENYKGDMRIIFDEPFARECLSDDIRKSVDSFRNSQVKKMCILKYEDENGKTMHDYLRTGRTHIDVKHMAKAKDILHGAEISKFSKASGATIESDKKAYDFDMAMSRFYYIDSSTVPEEFKAGDCSVHKGLKTSRAFNKVCAHFGVDKWDKYNKEFAKYSDLVSGKERILKFIISLNPLDYLTMSFGKSWASCHTIDKSNRRNMPNAYSGAYCNGVLSYMLDGSSIVSFVLDGIEDNMYEIGKLYRCMFHVNADTCKCIQGRIYPQGNDGSTDLYKKFRAIFEREFTPLFGLGENRWKAAGVDGVTDDKGYHYRDYFNFSSCRTFYPTEKGNVGTVEIGAYGICPYCGEEYHASERLGHHSCNIPEYAYENSTIDAVLNVASNNVNANATVIDWSNVATIRAVDPIVAYDSEPITFAYNSTYEPSIDLDTLNEVLNSVSMNVPRWTITLNADDRFAISYE